MTKIIMIYSNEFATISWADWSPSFKTKPKAQAFTISAPDHGIEKRSSVMVDQKFPKVSNNSVLWKKKILTNVFSS